MMATADVNLLSSRLNEGSAMLQWTLGAGINRYGNMIRLFRRNRFPVENSRQHGLLKSDRNGPLCILAYCNIDF